MMRGPGAGSNVPGSFIMRDFLDCQYFQDLENPSGLPPPLANIPPEPTDKIVPIDTKFIIYKGDVIPLTRDERGLYRSEDGTYWGFHDKSMSADDKDVCGVGLLSLPNWDYFKQVNEDCAVHDYMYESPVFQAFHERRYADGYLLYLLELTKHPILGPVFSSIARLLGAPLWENPLTR